MFSWGHERCERLKSRCVEALPIARKKRAAITTHTGSEPVAETTATAALTVAIKRSAPMSTRLSGNRSTRAPANVPKSASGRNPASDANDSMLADSVAYVMCQTKPICRMELVSTETSSPPHTHASLSFQEVFVTRIPVLRQKGQVRLSYRSALQYTTQSACDSSDGAWPGSS